MSPSVNVPLYDLHVILNGLEQFAIILAVILAVSLLLKKKSIIPEKYRNPVLLLVGFWILIVLSQYVLSTYSYIHATRPSLQEESQRQS